MEARCAPAPATANRQVFFSEASTYGVGLPLLLARYPGVRRGRQPRGQSNTKRAHPPDFSPLPRRCRRYLTRSTNSRAWLTRTTLGNLAESLKQQLAKERAERIKLEREVAMLKAELATAKRFDEIVNRLDRIEGAPRSASRGALIASARAGPLAWCPRPRPLVIILSRQRP